MKWHEGHPTVDATVASHSARNSRCRKRAQADRGSRSPAIERDFKHNPPDSVEVAGAIPIRSASF